jgi:hypothetical protein
MHEESAARHEAAAALWATRHEPERADFERRCAALERDLSELELRRMRLEQKRASLLGQADDTGRAELARMTGEIGRRTAEVRAIDAELESDRATLREQRGLARDPARPPGSRRPSNAAGRSASQASEDEPEVVVGAGSPDGAVAGGAVPYTRQSARRLRSVLRKTADALDETARLADEHARAREQSGHREDAAAERQAASQAREAAGRARAQAQRWLTLTAPGPPGDPGVVEGPADAGSAAPAQG